MAKITLPTITAGYQSATQLTAGFAAIVAEMQDKILYRDNTSAESNVMEQELDMNTNDINNAGNITANNLTIAGVNLAAQLAAAAASAAAALASENNAATSATNAGTSETNAGASATSATASAGSATTSAAAALTSENNAATSATNAATSAATATTQATNAGTSATNAASSATTAGTSATNAGTSETNAAASANAAAASADAFDDVYLGSKAAAPTVDNDGDPLAAGMIYFNTATNDTWVYNGASWQLTVVDTSGLVSKTSTTGSAVMPAGTTAQRDGSPVTGYIRYNSTTTGFEGYGASSWGSIGGGATGGGTDAVFQENERVVTTDYTLTTSKSAMSVGPVTINTGITVTIPSGESWVVL